MYKAVLLDIDSTIFNNENDYCEDLLVTIDKLQKAGILVSLATSRTKYMTDNIIKSLKLNSPLILDNGGIIYDPKKDTVPYKITIEANLVNQIITEISKYSDIRYGISSVEKFYANNKYFLELSGYLNKYGIIKIDNVRINYDNVISIWIRDLTLKESEQVQAITKDYNLHLLEEYDGDNHSIFIMNHKAKKNVSFIEWCSYCSIIPEEVIFIGDSDNDIEISKLAGLGCCVGNASTNLKQVSKIIAHNSYGAGTSEILNTIFKLK